LTGGGKFRNCRKGIKSEQKNGKKRKDKRSLLSLDLLNNAVGTDTPRTQFQTTMFQAYAVVEN
jgi:hypothetical protein